MPKDQDLGEHKRPPHVGSVCETSPEKKRILTASLCVLNAFFAEVGTIFQSFLVTNFLSKNACADLESFVRAINLDSFVTDFNGQSSAHQRNAIEMAFCWRADDAGDPDQYCKTLHVVES